MIEAGHQLSGNRHKNSKYTAADAERWLDEMETKRLSLSKYSKEIKVSYTTMRNILERYYLGDLA